MTCTQKPQGYIWKWCGMGNESRPPTASWTTLHRDWLILRTHLTYLKLIYHDAKDYKCVWSILTWKPATSIEQFIVLYPLFLAHVLAFSSYCWPLKQSCIKWIRIITPNNTDEDLTCKNQSGERLGAMSIAKSTSIWHCSGKPLFFFCNGLQ